MAPACLDNDQCSQDGTWCKGNDGLDAVMGGRCDYCGGPTIPLLLQLDPSAAPSCSLRDPTTAECPTLNNADETFTGGFNTSYVAEMCASPVAGQQRIGQTRKPVGDHDDHTIEDNGEGGFWYGWTADSAKRWCERCTKAETGFSVDPLTSRVFTRENTLAMQLPDWAALVLSCLLVGLTVVGELKDIDLCRLALRHYQAAGAKPGAFWINLLGALCTVRRWFFLPALVSTVPLLVLWRGSDATSICLNTVAMLFLAEIDNIMYRVGLDESIRREVESAARVELQDAEREALAKFKTAHLVAIPIMLLSTVVVAGYSPIYVAPP